jgi:ferrous iron transport protein A
MTKQPTVYPLTLGKKQQQFEVIAINGGQNLVKRLLAMGIANGSKISVVDQVAGQGLIIICQDTRWALGYAMAHRILVTEVRE